MRNENEIDTDPAAGGAASAAASCETTVQTVVKPGKGAEVAAPEAAAAVSMLISCFIFISNFSFLSFDLNLDFYFVTLHIGVVIQICRKTQKHLYSAQTYHDEARRVVRTQRRLTSTLSASILSLAMMLTLV